MRKAISLLLVSILIVLMLVACGSSSSATKEPSTEEAIIGTWTAESDPSNNGEMKTTTIVFREDGFGSFSLEDGLSYTFEYEVDENTVTWEYYGKAVYDYDSSDASLKRFSDGLVFTKTE